MWHLSCLSIIMKKHHKQKWTAATVRVEFLWSLHRRCCYLDVDVVLAVLDGVYVGVLDRLFKCSSGPRMSRAQHLRKEHKHFLSLDALYFVCGTFLTLTVFSDTSSTINKKHFYFYLTVDWTHLTELIKSEDIITIVTRILKGDARDTIWIVNEYSFCIATSVFLDWNRTGNTNKP